MLLERKGIGAPAIRAYYSIASSFLRKLEKADIFPDIVARREILQSLLKTHDMPWRMFNRIHTFKRTWYKKVRKAKERGILRRQTPAYLQWRAKGAKLVKKVQQLVIEFNHSRSRGFLQVDVWGESIASIYTGPKDYETKKEKLTKKEKGELGKRIKSYQKTFNKFASFLEAKFYAIN